MTVPKSLIALVLMFASVYLVSGGLYLLIEGEGSLWVRDRATGRATPVVPRLRHQILGEGYIVGMLLILGSMGLLLPYMGLRLRVNPETMRSLLIVSVLLILASAYLMLSIYFSKLQGRVWP